MPLDEDIAFHKKLGNYIVALRKDKGISQKDLAYDSDLDISTLSRLERGVLNPRLDTLLSIARTLNVNIKDLFDF